MFSISHEVPFLPGSHRSMCGHLLNVGGDSSRTMAKALTSSIKRGKKSFSQSDDLYISADNNPITHTGTYPPLYVSTIIWKFFLPPIQYACPNGNCYHLQIPVAIYYNKSLMFLGLINSITFGFFLLSNMRKSALELTSEVSPTSAYFLRRFIFSFFPNIYLATPGLSCGMWDLVPWPGIKPSSPALGVQSLGH